MINTYFYWLKHFFNSMKRNKNINVKANYSFKI